MVVKGNEQLHSFLSRDYEHGFVTPIEVETLRPV